MSAAFHRKFFLIQLALLLIFSGVGCACVLATVVVNPVQRQWELIVFAWEFALLGLPLAFYQPMFRRLRPWLARIESGGDFSAEDRVAYHTELRRYPSLVALLCFWGSMGAYGLAAAQLRYMARLPWDGVATVLLAGAMAGLLWAVVEYFLLDHLLRPLTGLCPVPEQLLGRGPRVPLGLKMFSMGVTLVLAALGLFWAMAYSRAARILEGEVGDSMLTRMRDMALLVAELPRTPGGQISDVWWALATEYRLSPNGYFHLIDEGGRILATYPGVTRFGISRMDEEVLLPEVVERVVREDEGWLVDRVDYHKLVGFVRVPDSPYKVVGIAPRRDFSKRLDYFVYSGLVGMGVAVLLCLGVGSLVASTVTTPLAEVTRVASAVAQNRDLAQRVSFSTSDEVGILAHAFNGMADELQRYAEDLERLVQERTRELERRTEQLEAKTAEMRDFLYVVSHDLRAPLINLEGFSRALRDSLEELEEVMGRLTGAAADRWEGLREEIHEALGFILQSVRKMDQLAKGLLELSRIETRGQPPQPIDVQRLVEDVLAAFRFQIDEKGIQVTVSRLLPVLGDPLRVNQVFSNLLDNAIKYMQPGGGSIEVGCEKDEGMLRFFVRDTGPGIRPEDQPKVFRPFTRMASADVPGDGVGLAAVRKIVEKHGGRIWVESTPGQGSTFWLTLPPAAGGDGEEELDERHEPGGDGRDAERTDSYLVG